MFILRSAIHCNKDEVRKLSKDDKLPKELKEVLSDMLNHKGELNLATIKKFIVNIQKAVESHYPIKRAHKWNLDTCRGLWYSKKEYENNKLARSISDMLYFWDRFNMRDIARCMKEV